MINDPAFIGYAFECDRKNQINEVIEEFLNVFDPNDTATQRSVFNSAGLDPEELTPEEIEYIEQEVNRQWQQTN